MPHRDSGAAEIAGILNVAKPLGMTSHDVVAAVRRLLHQRRVGHAGTLDPDAAGVLLICLGAATRVSEYLMDGTKEYRATICFGATSTTDDAAGTLTPVPFDSSLDRSAIEAALPTFLGDILQTPPAFAAIKVAGQPLYKRARAGEVVTVAPRPVRIDRIDLVSWQPPELTVVVTCSKGTYIRALARDLGQALRTGAYLSALTRTASGRFRLADSLTLAQVELAARGTFLDRLVYPIDAAVADWPAIVLESSDVARIRHGQAIAGPPGSDEQGARAYEPGGRIVALLRFAAGDSSWHPEKVFPEDGADDVA